MATTKGKIKHSTVERLLQLMQGVKDPESIHITKELKASGMLLKALVRLGAIQPVSYGRYRFTEKPSEPLAWKIVREYNRIQRLMLKRRKNGGKRKYQKRPAPSVPSVKKAPPGGSMTLQQAMLAVQNTGRLYAEAGAAFVAAKKDLAKLL